jgi:hypothetical protein
MRDFCIECSEIIQGIQGADTTEMVNHPQDMLRGLKEIWLVQRWITGMRSSLEGEMISAARATGILNSMYCNLYGVSTKVTLVTLHVGSTVTYHRLSIQLRTDVWLK